MGTMFLGGPPLVEAATGEKVTAEELGGATLHCSVSGCADYFAANETESTEYVRSIVETLNIPGSFSQINIWNQTDYFRICINSYPIS